ncbi:MAG: SBBP repeat-containing protein [Methylococcaceae bacterium]
MGLSLVLFLSSVTVFAFASYSAIEIIDNTILKTPNDVAFDSLGNLYVLDSGNGVFRIATDGTIAQIIDKNDLNSPTYPYALVVDSSDNIYFGDYGSHNVFKIDASETCSIVGTPCTITEIIDTNGDGANELLRPDALAVDSSGNVYVTGSESDNVFKITTPDTCSTTGTPCTITQIIDDTGDGTNELDGPNALAVDSSDNVYVSGHLRYASTSASTNNVFKIITPDTCSTGGTPCTITEIIDSSGDGTNDLIRPNTLAVDSSDNIYVTGGVSSNAFKIITPDTCSTVGTPCTITQIIDTTGDGTNSLTSPSSMTIDSSDNIYVGGYSSHNVFKITSDGSAITQIIDSSGDGTGDILARTGNYFISADALAVDSSDNIYVIGGLSDNVFKIFENPVETSDSCSSDCTPPSLESLELNNTPNWLTAKNQTFNIGDKQVMKFVYSENEGIDDIKDIEIGFGLPTKKSPMYTSEIRLQINTFNGNLTSLVIDDDNKLFLENSTTVTVDKVQCGLLTCLEYTLEFIWAEIPFDNYLLITASDDHRNTRYDSSQYPFTVIGETLNEYPTLEIYNRYTSTKHDGYSFNITRTDKVTDMWIDEKGKEWCGLGNDRFELVH